MWRKPDDPETQWMYAITKYYAEFPPLLPPSASKLAPFPKKVEGSFLHYTDSLLDIEEPLLRPEVSEQDASLFQRLATELQLNITMMDAQSHQEFMGYNFLCYMEIAVVPPSLRQTFISAKAEAT